MNSRSNASISFTEFLYFIVDNIKILIRVPLLFSLLTTLYIVFISYPTYTSTSKFMSGSSESNVSQMMGLASQFGINIPSIGTSEPVWVYQDIIKSRSIARKVLRRNFNLPGLKEKRSLLSILSSPEDILDYGKDTLESMLIDYLLDYMIFVTEDSKTGIFTLDVETFNPYLSKKLNEAIIQEVDLHQQHYNSKIASKTRLFIEERITQTKGELEKAEEELKTFRDRNRRIENSPALLLEQERLMREVMVLTGVFTTLKQQLETTKIEEVKESDYVVVIDFPEIPLDKSSPNVILMLLTNTLLGIIFALFYVVIKVYFSSVSKKDSKKIEEIKNIFQNNILETFSFKK